MVMSIPNILTLIRIGLIPVFILVFYLPFEWVNVALTVIFTLAGITDWLDGYLARKLDQFSRFGAFLDPVADKLIVAAALVLLVQREPHFWMVLPAIIIIGREIAVSALREWMAEAGERAQVAVSVIGKVKTTVQMVAIGFLLFEESVFGLPIELIGYVLLYMAVFLTLWSMVIYLQAALPALREPSAELQSLA